MTELMLIVCIWTVAGAIAVYAYGVEMPKDADFLATVFLALAWPWWLSHYNANRKEKTDDARLVPVRIETREKLSRKK